MGCKAKQVKMSALCTTFLYMSIYILISFIYLFIGTQNENPSQRTRIFDLLFTTKIVWSHPIQGPRQWGGGLPLPKILLKLCAHFSIFCLSNDQIRTKWAILGAFLNLNFKIFSSWTIFSPLGLTGTVRKPLELYTGNDLI